MLIAQQLHKHFDDFTALHSLDLAVQPGEIYALLGPNGAGKTTTISCFLGFIRPDGGRLRVGAADPADDPEQARKLLAYIPEMVNLYANFNALENLAYFSELAGFQYPQEQLRHYLAEAGLQESAFSQRVSGYSKGMRQKVGIAIALAKQAQALLLDEPTSGLDPSASFEFSGLLQKLSGQGVAILMATHDLFRARDVATRVGIMRQGRLLAELDKPGIHQIDLEQLYLETMRQ